MTYFRYSNDSHHPLVPALARCENFPQKPRQSPPFMFFSIISSEINFYNLGAPLRRLAEGHPGELLMKFPSGWASVPGSLERWLLPGLGSFLPVASCLRGAGLWNRCYIQICLGKSLKSNMLWSCAYVDCGRWVLGKG